MKLPATGGRLNESLFLWRGRVSEHVFLIKTAPGNNRQPLTVTWYGDYGRLALALAAPLRWKSVIINILMVDVDVFTEAADSGGILVVMIVPPNPPVDPPLHKEPEGLCRRSSGRLWVTASALWCFWPFGNNQFQLQSRIFSSKVLIYILSFLVRMNKEASWMKVWWCQKIKAWRSIVLRFKSYAAVWSKQRSLIS